MNEDEAGRVYIYRGIWEQIGRNQGMGKFGGRREATKQRSWREGRVPYNLAGFMWLSAPACI